MFGNYLNDPQRQADNILFAKLVAMNCLNFDLTECNFSEKIMALKDKNGQSREGSSRVALQMATGITYCYTLEFNYHNGKRINTLAPKYVRANAGIEAETPVSDPTSKIYANQTAPPYTVEMFEDCGRGFGSALLDLIDDNPVSRIPLSCYKSVANVRQDILTNIDKYSSGNVALVGANNFASTNQKVANKYADTKSVKTNGKTNLIGSAGPTKGGKSQASSVTRSRKPQSDQPKQQSASQPRQNLQTQSTTAQSNLQQ